MRSSVHSPSLATGGSWSISPIIRSCTPPNSNWFRRTVRSTASMASITSARTMLISSITRSSSLRISWSLSRRKGRVEREGGSSTCIQGSRGASVGTTIGPKGSWKKECMVTPPALMAATPVGASTAICLGARRTSSRRKVVFPVPARPVRNRQLSVLAMNSRASCAS